MSLLGLTRTVLATGLTEAIVRDASNDAPTDISIGQFGPHVTAWINMIAECVQPPHTKAQWIEQALAYHTQAVTASEDVGLGTDENAYRLRAHATLSLQAHLSRIPVLPLGWASNPANYPGENDEFDWSTREAHESERNDRYRIFRAGAVWQARNLRRLLDDQALQSTTTPDTTPVATVIEHAPRSGFQRIKDLFSPKASK